MVSSQITIKWVNGFHMRPVSAFVKQFSTCQSELTISHNEVSVNAKSILSLLSLTVLNGDQITVSVDGSDEQEVLTAILNFFDEEDE